MLAIPVLAGSAGSSITSYVVMRSGTIPKESGNSKTFGKFCLPLQRNWVESSQTKSPRAEGAGASSFSYCITIIHMLKFLLSI
jgi:hypothetical protein